MRMTMLATLPCLLAACNGSTVAEIEAPPETIVRPCTPPVDLPDRDATQAEVEIWWGRDRTALRDCAERHELMVKFIAGQFAAR